LCYSGENGRCRSRESRKMQKLVLVLLVGEEEA
jgi:hypothetical protein